MTVTPVFPRADIARGMYESFYLRAVSPHEPVGAWIRYTVKKHPGAPPKGSLWLTLFDASRGRPFMCKSTVDQLSVPGDGWIAIGADASFSPTFAEGSIAGQARWSLHVDAEQAELRHLERSWLYRAPLPRTKLTSPAPAATFNGTIELPDRTIELEGWRGMVGHNWGSEHAERWIWLHGIDFEEDRSAWIDVALGRVLVAKRLTPWVASGAISLDGRRVRLGGLGRRGVRVAESPARCTISLPGESGFLVQAHVDVPGQSAAGWRYGDPGDGEHDVVNCSVASLTVNARPREGAARTLHTAHGAAYELGMRERNHGVPLAPYDDD